MAAREMTIDFRGSKWVIKIELIDDPAESQWLSISDQPAMNGFPQIVELRVSLAHPFMIRFAQTDPDDVEVLLRMAAGIGLAEKLARLAGHRYSGSLRRNLNDLLRTALCQA
jgi:hypothetical protein